MIDIEKLTAFHGIRSYLTVKDQEELASKMGLTKDEISQRLFGKDKEIEFLLSIDYLGECEHIMAFDESASQLTRTNTPDLFVVLKDGRKLLIEIKSTRDDKWEVAKKQVINKEKVANIIGAPLYFAINIRGQWGLFSSDYLRQRNFKIKIENYPYSEFDNFFGNRYWVFMEGYRILSVYSEQKIGGIRNHNYGGLVSKQIYFNDKLLLEVNDKNIIQSIVLESLHDVAANQYQDIKDLGNGFTQIEERIIKNTTISYYNFLLSLIRHTIHELGYVSDANAYFKGYLARKNKVPFKEVLDITLVEMKNNGAPIISAIFRPNKSE